MTKQQQANREQVKIPLVAVEIPVGEIESDSFVSRHVDVQLVNRETSFVLKRVFRGLDQAGARLNNGRRVANNADVIRWVLEQIAGSLKIGS